MLIPWFIGGAEIFFIMFVVVLVFGADKIPEIARNLGKSMRQLKDATEDIKKEIYKTAEKNGVDTSITQDIKKEIDEVKKSITEVPGSMKRNF